MVQICLSATDRAVALARASRMNTNLEPDSPAVTAPYVGLPLHNASAFVTTLYSSERRIGPFGK